MLINDHLQQPPPETRLWRYMSFSKFMACLSNKSLFFPQLKYFDDKYEGWSRGMEFDFPQGTMIWQEQKKYITPTMVRDHI